MPSHLECQSCQRRVSLRGKSVFQYARRGWPTCCRQSTFVLRTSDTPPAPGRTNPRAIVGNPRVDPADTPATGVNLARGDQARPAGGGPLMAVEDVYSPVFAYRYRCVWADPKAGLQDGLFRADEIVAEAR